MEEKESFYEDATLAVENVCEGAYQYKRNSSAIRREAEAATCRAYGGLPDAVMIASSGLNAIMMTLQALVEVAPANTPLLLLFSNEVYTEMPGKCLAKLQTMFPQLSFQRFDVRLQPAVLRRLIAKKRREHYFIVGMYLEAAGNPSSEMLDWDALAATVDDFPPLIVDNTWCSPFVFNPFRHGAAVVIDSATKYITQGGAVSGIISLRQMPELQETLLANMKAYGIHVLDSVCRAIVSGLQQLPKLMPLFSAVTKDIVCSAWKEGITVVHPLTTGSGAFARYCDWNPGVFLLHVPLPTACTNRKRMHDALLEAYKQCHPSEDLLWATSYGKRVAILDAHPRLGKASKFQASHKSKGAFGAWLRVSVGYTTHAKSLVTKLQAILDAFQNNVNTMVQCEESSMMSSHCMKK